MPRETHSLALLHYEEKGPALWKEDTPDFYAVKGIVESLLRDLKIVHFAFERSREPFLHPGKSADVFASGEKIGFLGVLHPGTTERLDLKTAKPEIMLGEIDVDMMLSLVPVAARYNEEIPYQNGHLLWQQEKPLMVSLKGPGWDYAEIDDNLVGKNFILKSDVTWDATGIIICGAIFRSEPDLVNGKQYEFMYLRLSGLPAWQIAYNEFGKFDNTFTKTQYSDAIDQENGATNQVVLVAEDEQFNLYINGAHQGRYFDYSKQRMEGNFAFSGSQDSGEGTCNFENSWVWALEETD